MRSQSRHAMEGACCYLRSATPGGSEAGQCQTEQNERRWFGHVTHADNAPSTDEAAIGISQADERRCARVESVEQRTGGVGGVDENRRLGRDNASALQSLTVEIQPVSIEGTIRDRLQSRLVTTSHINASALSRRARRAANNEIVSDY